MPRRSASTIVGPTESAKLHAWKLRVDKRERELCVTRAITVSAHFSPARQKSCVAMSVSTPFDLGDVANGVARADDLRPVRRAAPISRPSDGRRHDRRADAHETRRDGDAPCR